MAVEEVSELTSPNKHIKTTTTYRVPLGENDLKSSKMVLQQPRL